MGDVDDEFAHLFEAVDDVHVEGAGLVGVGGFFDVGEVLAAEEVTVNVDGVFGLFGVADVAELDNRRREVEVHGGVGVVHEVDHLVEALQHVFDAGHTCAAELVLALQVTQFFCTLRAISGKKYLSFVA